MQSWRHRLGNLAADALNYLLRIQYSFGIPCGVNAAGNTLHARTAGERLSTRIWRVSHLNYQLSAGIYAH